ncbi:MAG: late competence development ComFB family protein [Oscillospiraceae bacterium]|jgi:hypothetical protein|nr:late competence development ComFB family protein [Oscillospiraceae bacterium]MCI1990326.1 late competence development ComFB family protein [Oscillospiraceae bacterium]MCI2034605.1 late competence development ComFB family protein [Oscillospiraceae bacterium]
MARTKREIDKERMYKKLMPSGRRAAKAPAENAARDAGGARAESAAAAAARTSAARRPSGPRRVAVPAMDNRRTAVVNTMEAAVLGKLDSVLERFSCCRCDRCKKDIVALALNKLPPRYKVLAEGQPQPDLDPQTNAQVVAAMIQAVIKVRANPRH